MIRCLVAFSILMGLGIASTSASEHQVLRPDGSAAAGVKIRLLERNKPERTLQADENGRFKIEEANPFRFSSGVTALIQAEDTAIGIWNPPGDKLQLFPAYSVSGRVLEAKTNNPVADAKVVIDEFRNYAPISAIHAWNHVKTDDEGNFVMPGAVFDGSNRPVVALLHAAKEIGGFTHTGGLEIDFRGDADFWKPVRVPLKPPRPIRLYPKGSVRGKIIHRQTGEPIEGAEVTLHRHFGNTNAIAFSKSNGVFELPDVHSFRARRFSIRHPGFANMGISPVHNRPPTDPHLEGLEIPLSSMVKVIGVVIDTDTGKPPIVPVEINPIHVVPVDDRWVCGTSGRHVETNESGEFQFELPVGSNELKIRSTPEFQQPVYLSSTKVMVETAAAFKLEISRNPGILFELSDDLADSPDGKVITLARITGDGVWDHFQSRRFFVPAEKWGQKIELKLRQGKKILTEPMVFQARSEDWPVPLQLPSDAGKE